jgi:hypothetical protein
MTGCMAWHKAMILKTNTNVAGPYATSSTFNLVAAVRVEEKK